MDLGNFAEEVHDTVVGICGDAVVETHTQAEHVLDALLRRPGMNHRELAAVFGITLEQLERCRAGGCEESQNDVYDNLCRLDAVYTWNVLIQRINHAAHWREEFREMWNEDDSSSEEEDEMAGEAAGVGPQDGLPGKLDKQGQQGSTEQLVSAGTREKARALLAKHLDAPERLRRRLIRRLDDEVTERCPEEKDYRHCARSITANFRRNTMLAAGYAAGRVPPQWIVLCDAEALAPRMRQLQRRVLRNECLKEVREDEATAELKRRAWVAARATDLAPPPPHEDPFGEGRRPGAAAQAARAADA